MPAHRFPSLAVLAVLAAVIAGNPAPCHAGGAPQVKVKISRNRYKEFDGSDYDNAERKFGFTVKLTNKTMTPIKGLSGEFIMVGRVFDDKLNNRDETFIVLKTVDVKADLGPSEKKDISIGPFITKFDSNDVAKYGADYAFYGFILRDAEGNVFIRETDRMRILKTDSDYEKLAGFKPLRGCFNSDLRPESFQPNGIDLREAKD